jgi:hypothetical protein
MMQFVDRLSQMMILGQYASTHFLVYIKSPSPISASIVVPSVRERVEADTLSKPVLSNKPTIPGQKPFESSGLRLEADKPLLSGWPLTRNYKNRLDALYNDLHLEVHEGEKIYPATEIHAPNLHPRQLRAPNRRPF